MPVVEHLVISSLAREASQNIILSCTGNPGGLGFRSPWKVTPITFSVVDNDMAFNIFLDVGKSL